MMVVKQWETQSDALTPKLEFLKYLESEIYFCTFADVRVIHWPLNVCELGNISDHSTPLVMKCLYKSYDEGEVQHRTER